MNVKFERDFLRDVQRLQKRQRDRVEQLISQIKNAEDLRDIANLRKLRGEQSHYRIRQGNYRCGIMIEDGVVTFVRYLHRRDIYRYFP